MPRFTRETMKRLNTVISDKFEIATGGSIGLLADVPLTSVIWYGRDYPTVIHSVGFYATELFAGTGTAKIEVGIAGTVAKYATYTFAAEAANAYHPIAIVEEDIAAGQVVIVTLTIENVGGEGFLIMEIGDASQAV